jgi:hypothetical protein
MLIVWWARLLHAPVPTLHRSRQLPAAGAREHGALARWEAFASSLHTPTIRTYRHRRYAAQRAPTAALRHEPEPALFTRNVLNKWCRGRMSQTRAGTHRRSVTVAGCRVEVSIGNGTSRRNYENAV